MEQKEAVKKDNDKLNQKFIEYEEENFGLKRTQLDILTNLKHMQATAKKE